MASIHLRRIWPDGEMLEVRAYADESHPEGLAVARENALTALAEASEIVQPFEAEETDQP